MICKGFREHHILFLYRKPQLITLDDISQSSFTMYKRWFVSVLNFVRCPASLKHVRRFQPKDQGLIEGQFIFNCSGNIFSFSNSRCIKYFVASFSKTCNLVRNQLLKPFLLRLILKTLIVFLKDFYFSLFALSESLED